MNSKFMGMVYVFPTHVGVFPKEERDQWRERRLPHARGGVSAHVGVFPPFILYIFSLDGLPHARGGVSRGKPEPDPHPASSPRTWGCFSWWRNDTVSAAVFPTHVGVFHARGGLVRFWHCLPHARGGAPSRGCPPKAPSSRLGLFTSTLDIDSFIWREWQKGRRTCLNIF